MLGILYPYAWKPLLATLYDLYNTQWRGLAELLILIKGQCEGLIGGISDGKFTPAPFLFPSTNLILTSRCNYGKMPKNLPAQYNLKHLKYDYVMDGNLVTKVKINSESTNVQRATITYVWE